MLWWFGYPTSDGRKVCVHMPAVGAATVTVAGTTFTGSSVDQDDIDDRGGVSMVSVTGLSEGTHSISIYDGVETVISSMRTSPSIGGTIAWGSCFNTSRQNFGAQQIVNTWKADLFIAQGDYQYKDTTASAYWHSGAAPTKVDNDITRANYVLTMPDPMSEPYAKRMNQYCGIALSTDDHEFGNDWDGTLAQGNNNSTGNTSKFANQGEADTFEAMAMDVMTHWSQGNPPGGGASQQWGACVIGSLHIINLELTSNRAANGATDDFTEPGAGKSALGETQLDFLLTELSANRAPFKIISANQRTAPVDNGHANSWGANFAKEVTYVNDHIYDNNITSCCFITGDHHNGNAYYVAGAHILDVTACPITGTPQPADVGWATGVIWKSTGNSGVARLGDRLYGVVRASGADYIEVFVVDWAGRIRYKVRLNAGSNAIVYPTTEIG
jgi:hypothetical protein